MKAIIKLFLIIIPITTFSQTYSSIISDSTIISFIKWEIKNGDKYSESGKIRFRKKAQINILQYDSINFKLADDTNLKDWQKGLYLFNRKNNNDLLFSDSEKDFFLTQFNAIKNTEWVHKIKNAKWRSWKNSKNTYSYGVPLFSSDGKYVLIKKSFYCGDLCAYGGFYLYQRTKLNEWKLLKTLNSFIS